MKRACLTQHVIFGIICGLLASQLSLASEESKSANDDFMELVANTGGNITYHPLTEDEMLLELNEEGAQIFKSLSPERKALALRIASRSCNGTNDCAGENACRTDKNRCLGLGDCKGTSKCAISDKNVAVKLAAKKMANKRNQAFQPPPSSS